MTTAVAVLLVLLALKFAAATALDLLNMRNVRAHAGRVPEAFKSFMDEATYSKGVNYTLDKTRFCIFENACATLFLAVILVLWILPRLYDFGLEEGKSAAFRLVDYRDAQRTVGSVFTATNRDYVNHVAGIDYRLIDREVLRTKYSCAPENPNIPNSQIWCYEGVGSVDGPFSTLLEDVNPEEVAVPYDVRCLVNNVPLYGLFTSVEIGATSIAPPTRTDKESLIFDLSGRRLNEKPEHGFYIQDGRTHLAE